MLTRSREWKQIVKEERFLCESVAEIDGVDYASISAPVIERGLFPESLSIGNCVSASLQISIRSDSAIAQSSGIVIKNRLVSGEDEDFRSEFLPAGTFWISRRSFDIVNKLTVLTCYDAMLKTNTAYPLGQQSDWPKTEAAVVQEIAELIGVEVDSRTVIDPDSPLIERPETYTVQQVLGFIGVAHAGNWIVTKENRLRLIPITTAPTAASLRNAEYVNLFGVTGSLTEGRVQSITGMILSNDQKEGQDYAAGNDTGYVVRCAAPFASQSACNAIYSRLAGAVYRPYTAMKGIYDPAAELGDPLVRLADPDYELDDNDAEISVMSYLYSEAATYGFAFRGNVSAPTSAELEDEYPYLGPVGPKGNDGRAIIGQVVTYSQSTNPTADPDTLVWSSTIPTVDPGSYLWTRTTFQYSSEPLEEHTYTVALQGETGIGVESETQYYTITDDPDNAPDSPEDDPTIWDDEKPERDVGEYLWMCRETTYTDGTVSYTAPMCITGDQGDQGVGIAERTIYYAKNRSNTIPPGEGADWDTTVPTRTWGEYIWWYEYTLYNDGSEESTTPVCSTGDTGSDGLALVINSDNGTVMQPDRTVTMTLTAEVQSGGEDVDPEGERFVYRWWQYKDNSGKPTYLGIGKQLTITVDSNLCDITTSIYFEIVESPESSIALATDGTLYSGKKRLARVVKNAQGQVTKVQYLSAKYNWTSNEV